MVSAKEMAGIELSPAGKKRNFHSPVDLSMESPASTRSTSTLVRSSLDIDSDPMMAVKWYHPNLSRHTADCMLIDNAPEGSYLLRPSSNYDRDQSYVLSIKLSSSVQHVKVSKAEGEGYRFGNSTFKTVDGFRKHIEIEKPVIGGDSGVTVVLKFPYTRFIEEEHMYTDVVHHAVTNMLDSSSDSDSDHTEETILTSTEYRDVMKGRAIAAKEGYLTKQGKFPKTWRVRWFVLRNQFFSYYKTKQSAKPIDTLDLFKARVVDYDSSKQKDFCFRIEFAWRTYFLYANNAEDCHNWVELLRSKIGNTSA